MLLLEYHEVFEYHELEKDDDGQPKYRELFSVEEQDARSVQATDAHIFYRNGHEIRSLALLESEFVTTEKGTPIEFRNRWKGENEY